MQVILKFKVIIITLFFLLVFCLERLVPAKKNNSIKKRVFKNLSFWPINILISVMIVVPFTYFAVSNHIFTRPDYLNVFILDLLILDLFIYLWHRANHEWSFLWRFHRMHHYDKTLDSTSAIRFHFFEIIFSSIFRSIFIILFAIPFSSVILFEILVFISAIFHHSNIKLPKNLENILSKVIITPSIHWVHHHAIRSDTDSNYGTIFSFWDLIFKSRSNFKRKLNMEIGVEGIKKDKNFVKLLFLPVLKK